MGLWEGRDDGFAYVCRHYACRERAANPATLTTELDSELAAERTRHAHALEHARHVARATQ